MSMYDYFEVYPPSNTDSAPQWDAPYFIEFTRWKKGDPMHWRLFKRCFIYPREEWEKRKSESMNDFASLIMGPEGHPDQLSNGTVNEYPTVIAMETPEFLRFMVDALNEKVKKESQTKMIEERHRCDEEMYREMNDPS